MLLTAICQFVEFLSCGNVHQVYGKWLFWFWLKEKTKGTVREETAASPDVQQAFPSRSFEGGI